MTAQERSFTTTASLDTAFATEERSNLLVGSKVRLVTVVVLAIWVFVENDGLREKLYYSLLVLSFGLPAMLIWYAIARGRYALWMKYVMVLFDACLLTFVLIAPPLLEPDPLPRTLILDLGNFAYAFVVLSVAAFVYSPRFALWTGGVMAVAWTTGQLWLYFQPDTLTAPRPGFDPADRAQLLAHLSNPYYMSDARLYRDAILLLVVAGILAAAVQRARGMVMRQTQAEIQRANLSRHFSPNLVADLAAAPALLERERRQPVGVLFADIVGFTGLCERAEPADVMEMLREFHRRVEAAVFACGGTLDKYMGDAVMATFGTPQSGTADAAATLRCAQALIAAMDDWNGLRQRQGLAPIRIGLGAHYGDCVLGNVGGEQRFEFTVIGDTVNVASRLEALSREMQARLVLSDDLVQAIRREDHDELLAGLQATEAVALRGRRRPLSLWRLG